MIEHLSGSSMNTYDNNIHEFYTRYVLGEEPEFFPLQVEAMEYGKEYEIALGKRLGAKWDTQKVVEEIIGGYKMYGLLDFYNYDDGVVIECKTKNGEWKEKDVHGSWQFRFYNRWCNKRGYQFVLHQFNKKKGVVKEDTINWTDKTFEDDFIKKAQEIERFLKSFNIELQRYDIQEGG